MTPSFLFDWFLATLLVAAVGALCIATYLFAVWRYGIDVTGWWRPLAALLAPLAIMGGYRIASKHQGGGDA